MKSFISFFLLVLGAQFVVFSTPICNPPTNVTNTDILPFSATYTWTPGGTESEWEVGIKQIGASVWLTTMVTAPIDTFTTITPFPVNLVVNPDFITDSSAIISWMHGGTESAWILEHKLKTSSNWITSDVLNTLNYHLTELIADTTYEVRVKAICGAYESDYTTPVEFTTEIGTQYQIAAMVYGPGTISPSGIVFVNEGENQLFTFTPESNSFLYQLRIDNEEVPFSNDQFEFLNVNAHHVIEVVFVLETLENSIPDVISLSPNPTSGTIEIIIDKTQLQVKECSLYDMYGKRIQSIPITTERSVIDLSGFASGVYILRLQSESGSISKIVIKK